MTIQEIERAIDALTPDQMDELYNWLDQRHPSPVDGKRKGHRAFNHEGQSHCRTGADLIEALQASPYRELEIEPARFRSPMPVRNVTF